MKVETQEKPLHPSEKLLEDRLGYQFRSKSLLQKALTHRSAVYEHRSSRNKARRVRSNERLEFIGDRVLGLVMAEWLLKRYPNEQEGDLGPRHAHLVSKTVLAQIAAKLELFEAIHVASHEEKVGVHHTDSVLADAVEAILGAMYLDGGLAPVCKLVHKVWADIIESQPLPPKDSKTALQEWVLARALPLPIYELISQEGPSHTPVFVIRVVVQDIEGRGEGRSKRIAESAAAKDLLDKLNKIKKVKNRIK
ncbi:ribonuclease III [Commensalibacter oyaizuii]|uniref:Ribonuclease 3 n=1 Tax=Commensalibacter oyaizuii TaxID=3043873 RepID=A0ABT6PYY1_9PROT|nr:ribonuclease III [Commensalibacter sp. TBRC 16381]MDI2090064.1 ribonuclease III [Commensalibacter sp. TBRC 16381]